MNNDEKDSMILGAILSAGDEYRIRRGMFVSAEAFTQYACCAIGAGVLYAGIPPEEIVGSSAISQFMAKYAVSENYAIGVSDGFEGPGGGVCYGVYSSSSPDYLRGYAVGEIVAREVLK